MRVLRKETALSQEIALLKETNNQIAVRHGLPPVGSTMINQYGIEWLVDGHVFVPTLSTLSRGTDPDVDDPRDLYPVILPQNLSPRLTNFIAETDRCTSKVIMPLDTLPHLRPHSAHTYGHWIDGLDSPHRILMFLDAAHAHETIIAHEIGHIWIDLVEDCEDYRIFRDISDAPKVHQWTNLQSFVLDNKVNEVLREKGFDMSVIENDVEESLLSFAAAIRSGYRPPTAREAAFVASTLATAMLDYEIGAQNTLQSLDMASTVFRQDLPDVYELACHLAASVRRHGYADRASIRKAVDACALLAFAFVGEPLNLDTDFVEEVPTEDYNDKYPEYFSGLPVPAKLEIARAMARLKIPGGSECRLEYSSTGSAHVKFCQRSGDWTKPVLLKNLRRLPQSTAFAGSNPMPQRGRPTMNKSFLSTPPNNSLHAGTISPAISPPLSGVQPVFPTGGSNGRRSYGPGLARFLSQARLAEQLGGEHPYGYAMNNPLINSYPSGLEPKCGGLDPCANYNAEYKKYGMTPFWDASSFTTAVQSALSSCPNYDPKILLPVLTCIVERESSDKPRGYTFPLSESGGTKSHPAKPTGPCQIVPGTDKTAICGPGWNSSLASHMACCAKLMCKCLQLGGGNLVTGCGFGKFRGLPSQWQVINEDSVRTKSTPNLNPDLKCCLIKRGWSNPSQTIPPATPK